MRVGIEASESHRVRLRRRSIIENGEDNAVANSHSEEDLFNRRDDHRWEGSIHRRRFERYHRIRGDFETRVRRENGQRRFVPSTRRGFEKCFRLTITRYRHSPRGWGNSRTPPILIENSQSTVNQRGNPRLRRLEKTRQKHVHLRRRRRLVGAKTAHRRRQKIRRFRRLGVDEVRPSHASKRDHRATLIPWIRRVLERTRLKRLAKAHRRIQR